MIRLDDWIPLFLPAWSSLMKDKRMRKLLLNRHVWIVLIMGLVVTAATAQSRRKKKDDEASPQALEKRAQEAEAKLATEYFSIADGFYRRGDIDKAKDYLVRLNEFRKGIPGVADKIKQLEELVMSGNSDSITIDTSKGWGEPIAEVTEGEAFRIAAAGDYKMTASLSLDVNGLPSKDPVNDLAGGAPFGSLVGLIVSGGKPGRPFAIRSGLQHKPKKGGLLYVRVNAPPGAKCTGKVQLQVSGRIVTKNNQKPKKKR